MSTTYQRIRINLRSPWNYEGETEKEWSCMFHLSGPNPMNPSEAELTALDLFDPIKQMGATSTHLSSFSYYPQGSNVASTGNTYTPAQHPCTETAWTQPFESSHLEVCLLCVCPVGLNSRGKRVYLRKWVHGIPHQVGDGNAHAPVAAGDPLTKWKTGSGPQSLVPVDPTGGAQGGPWTYETHLFTHQLRRGPKRKVTKETVYVPIPVP